MSGRSGRWVDGVYRHRREPLKRCKSFTPLPGSRRRLSVRTSRGPSERPGNPDLPRTAEIARLGDDDPSSGDTAGAYADYNQGARAARRTWGWGGTPDAHRRRTRTTRSRGPRRGTSRPFASRHLRPCPLVAVPPGESRPRTSLLSDFSVRPRPESGPTASPRRAPSLVSGSPRERPVALDRPRSSLPVTTFVRSVRRGVAAQTRRTAG